MISPEEARRRAELWARALLAEDWSARMLRDAYGDQDTALAMLTAAELHASWLLDVRAQSRPLPPHPGSCGQDARRPPAPPQCPGGPP